MMQRNGKKLYICMTSMGHCMCPVPLLAAILKNAPLAI